MKMILQKIKRFLVKVSFLVPTPLPRGMTEFGLWADSIIDAYSLPSNDSVRFALATMILHLDATSAYKPKHYFGMAALKSASNQIASGVMHELKDKQKALMEAEQAAAKKAAEEAAK